MTSKKIDLEKLMDSFYEINTSDGATLNEALKEYGYDPSSLQERNVNKIKRLIFTLTVETKKEIFSNLYSKAISLIKQAEKDSKEVIVKLLKQKSPNLQFRNLEKLDEENLRQILNETEILDFISQIEKEKPE